MGFLRRIQTGELVMLHGRHRFGRSRSNHTRLEGSHISGEHAALVWQSGAWELRDLGSRNGSSLGERTLTSGERVALEVGARIALGGEVLFEVVSLSEPSASAVSGEQVSEAEEDLLGIPSLEEPEQLLTFSHDQGWSDGENTLVDGQLLEVAGKSWRLHLPELLSETRDLSSMAWRLEQLTLVFRVSADEEYVELGLEREGELRWIPAKAHHYLALTLARALLRDLADGEGPEAAGWLHTEDLQRQLRASKNQVYVGVHRLKKELEAAGVVDGGGVVERRRTTQQLRLGCAEIRVETL